MDTLIIFSAKYLMVVIVVLLAYIWFKESSLRRRQIIGAVIIAGILAFLFSKFAGKLYYDPRPFVSRGIKPLIAHGADNGFPSEHAIFCMTLTTVIFFYRKQLAYWAALVTILVGSARVLAHVHSPIDIAAGIVLGIFAGWLGYFATTKMVRKKTDRSSKPAVQ